MDLKELELCEIRLGRRRRQTSSSQLGLAQSFYLPLLQSVENLEMGKPYIEMTAKRHALYFIYKNAFKRDSCSLLLVNGFVIFAESFL